MYFGRKFVKFWDPIKEIRIYVDMHGFFYQILSHKRFHLLSSLMRSDVLYTMRRMQVDYSIRNSGRRVSAFDGQPLTESEGRFVAIQSSIVVSHATNLMMWPDPNESGQYKHCDRVVCSNPTRADWQLRHVASGRVAMNSPWNSTVIQPIFPGNLIICSRESTAPEFVYAGMLSNGKRGRHKVKRKFYRRQQAEVRELYPTELWTASICELKFWYFRRHKYSNTWFLRNYFTITMS